MTERLRLISTLTEIDSDTGSSVVSIDLWLALHPKQATRQLDGPIYGKDHLADLIDIRYELARRTVNATRMSYLRPKGHNNLSIVNPIINEDDVWKRPQSD